jgi:2-oxoisovalerate dehydrogenase E2 component (dihydrolipoyl transacylase)
MPDFLLPDLGEGLAEAEIVTWHVQVGDMVIIDQIVVEVETAKAVVEVPVPFAGQVTELHGRPGEVLAVGKPLVTVEGAAAEPRTSPGQAGPSFAEPGTVTADAASDEGGASGNVLIGYGTSAGARRRRRSSRAPVQLAVSQIPGAEVQVAGAARPAGANGHVAVVSPLVRRLARDARLDISALHGSGSAGLITRRDVDQAIRGHVPAAQVVPEPEPAIPPIVSADAVRIPIRGLRKAVADKLSRSRREIPEATVWVDVDATGLLELRASLNADTTAPKVSLLALLSRFTILGLRRHPELNARIEGDEIVMGLPVNLGFAAQTDRGLLVPVVPDAQSLSLEQLSGAFAERTQRAREGKLGIADLTDGTFTINNYGVFGVDGSAAIINHPEVAILGIGRIIERPWVVNSRIVPRKLTQLTLAFDHRVCDGGTAGGFLRFVADCVESPTSALRHL